MGKDTLGVSKRWSLSEHNTIGEYPFSTAYRLLLSEPLEASVCFPLCAPGRTHWHSRNSCSMITSINAAVVLMNLNPRKIPPTI